MLLKLCECVLIVRGCVWKSWCCEGTNYVRFVLDRQQMDLCCSAPPHHAPTSNWRTMKRVGGWNEWLGLGSNED